MSTQGELVRKKLSTPANTKNMIAPKIVGLPYGESIVDLTPKLKASKIFEKPLMFAHARNDREKFVRYILFMYDVHSPYLKEYFDDVDERRAAVFDDLGLNTVIYNSRQHKASLTPQGQAVFNHTDYQFNQAIVNFWKLQNRYRAAAFFAMQNQYQETNKLLLEPNTGTTIEEKLKAQALKNKMVKEDLVTFTEKIESIKKEVFLGDIWLSDAAVADDMEEGATGVLEELMDDI